VAQFRNVTEHVLYTVTPSGLERVEPDSILTVPDDFAAARYWQTGETGEPVIWEAVDMAPAARGGKKSNPTPEPAVEAEDKE